MSESKMHTVKSQRHQTERTGAETKTEGKTTVFIHKKSNQGIEG